MELSRHISGKFNEELEQIQHEVLQMGGLVEQQLSQSLKALNEGDRELAQQVLDNDFKVNAMEVAIDEACTRIIAKRQPAASDLRLILAIIKTISDLERIADEAKKLAKVALDTFSEQEMMLLVSLEAMGHRALNMLIGVLNAFARLDAEEAFAVHKKDKKLDKEYESITRQLMTYMMEDPRSIPKVMTVFMSARSLERMGDRCKNIAEYIIYFVKGKDVRHISRNLIEERLKK